MRDNVVSVIVPCFNQAEYVSEALESVLAQSWEKWECIIVNDGSPDETADIARIFCERDARFMYVEQPNRGLSSARNKGIRETDGEFILPLDADDRISPDYLEKAVAILTDSPATKVVYCQAEYFGNRTGVFENEPYSFERLLIRNMIFCSSLFRRHDFIETAGYNENMKGGYEDWDFWITLLQSGGDVYMIPETHFFYRQKDVSMRCSIDRQLRLKLIDRIVKNHQDIYNDYLPSFLTQLADDRSFQGQLSEILTSRSYRLARLISSPIRFLKKLCQSGDSG